MPRLPDYNAFGVKYDVRIGMVLKHTDFMRLIASQIGAALPPHYAVRYGETRWLCQVYFGEERRIHYEVSRPFSRSGRWIELGLHFETSNRQRNQALLWAVDRHLLELQDRLGREVRAEVWDKGWAKVYEIYPDTELSTALATQTTQRFAEFIATLHPIYEFIEGNSL